MLCVTAVVGAGYEEFYARIRRGFYTLQRLVLERAPIGRARELFPALGSRNKSEAFESAMWRKPICAVKTVEFGECRLKRWF